MKNRVKSEFTLHDPLPYLHDPDKAEGVDDKKTEEDEDHTHHKQGVEVGVPVGVVQAELLQKI